VTNRYPLSLHSQLFFDEKKYFEKINKFLKSFLSENFSGEF
jgi:hypothetical protein